ncbi:MAG: LacI family DNA-binding transcriptional regulator, partial [Verrucomicrobiota bacterium]
DIAKAAGVSHPTVSRALNDSNLVSEKTKAKIQNLAKRLGYTPDPMLSALVKYRNNFIPHTATSSIALVCGSHMINRWSATIESAREYALHLGYGFEFYEWKEELSPKRHSQILRSRGIKGIILGPLTMKHDFESPNLDWENFATVTIGRFMDKPTLDSITENQFGAVRICLDEARKNGYKRPGLITHSRINLRTYDRLRSAFDAQMIDLPSEDRVRALLIEGDLTADTLKEWVEQERPDCLVGHSFVGENVKNHGWKIPGDFAFAAIDLQESDNQSRDYGGAMHNDVELARLAVATLNDHITTGTFGIPDQPKSVLLGSYWSDGDSFPKPNPQK